MASATPATNLQLAQLGPPPAGRGDEAWTVHECDAPMALTALVRRGRVDVVLVAEQVWPEAERVIARLDRALTVVRYVPGTPVEKGLLQQAADVRALRRETLAARQLLPAARGGGSHQFAHQLLGASDAMAGLRARLRQVGDGSGPVTIAGAPGTPLLAAAAALHAQGASGPLLYLNLRRPDAKEILLGTEEVALLDVAGGGTLILHHLDAADDALMPVLETLAAGIWPCLDDQRERAVPCRLVGTIARDPALPGTVSTASGLPGGWAARVVRVPTLAERRMDIPELIAAMDRSMHRVDPGVDAEHEWPGNDEELQMRCMLAAMATASLRSSNLVCDGTSTLADLERHAVVATLRSQGGHRRRTAQALGIGLRTLGVKLQQWRAAKLLPPGV